MCCYKIHVTLNNISVIFVGEGEPPTCCKSLTNFMALRFIEYTSPQIQLLNFNSRGLPLSKINTFPREQIIKKVFTRWTKQIYARLWLFMNLHLIVYFHLMKLPCIYN